MATIRAKAGWSAFFAAQTNELAPEENYDVAGADGATTEVDYGVFTHTIISALAKNPNITYRQLAQAVLSGYVADNWLRLTPLFQGGSTRRCSAADGIVPTQQWPVITATDGSLSDLGRQTCRGSPPAARCWSCPVRRRRTARRSG